MLRMQPSLTPIWWIQLFLAFSGGQPMAWGLNANEVWFKRPSCLIFECSLSLTPIWWTQLFSGFEWIQLFCFFDFFWWTAKAWGLNANEFWFKRPICLVFECILSITPIWWTQLFSGFEWIQLFYGFFWWTTCFKRREILNFCLNILSAFEFTFAPIWEIIVN